MRPFIVVLACALMSLVATPAGAAAQGGLGAPDFKDRFVNELDLDDFCDTGETVHLVERIVGNVWETDDGKIFRLAFSVAGTFTYGDATVYARNAGQVRDVLIAGDDQDEPHTHHGIETGLRSMLRAPGGGVVTLDHGYLEYISEFGEDHELLDLEVLKDAGGHPDFYDPVWCEAAVELLGIPAP
jgi:hypothetical protein